MTQDVIYGAHPEGAQKIVQQTRSLLTRDGMRLDADVYRPAAAGPLPVLLMRQPYGRAIASTVVYAHPRWYASQGYIVVIQDTRGRGTSEGEFRLFEQEQADGEDTVHWAANLPGCSGAVGMYGFSYQGMTQLYAAAARPEPLKALCPAMLAYDLYSGWAYEGGAFCLQPGLAWAIQLAAETARRRGDEAAYLELAAASQDLPLQGAIASQPEILQRLAPESFYHDWLAHPEVCADGASGAERSLPLEAGAGYWRSLIPDLSSVDLPMLHIGGWFDFYLRGTVDLYRRVTDPASSLQMQSPQHLWIGPWAHLPWNRRVGALDFGPEAASPIDHQQLRWFDWFLKGKETGVLQGSPVHLFEMGRNRWRSLPSWPSQNNSQNHSAAAKFSLVSGGLTALRLDHGRLIPTEPETPTPKTGPEAVDILVHDPWRPAPALGGHWAMPSGPSDRSVLDCRSDILTYTTEPLGDDLRLAGEVGLTLVCQADAPSFDLCAVLSVVRGNGVFNFSEGYRRVVQRVDRWGAVAIALQPTCICLAAGESLRLSLSAACFPAFAVNPGTGENPDQARAIGHQTITLQFRLSDATQLTLPACL